MTNQPSTAPVGGPYLQAAVFCDQVIQGNDGVLTLVRVIDRINHRVGRQDAPDDMELFQYDLTAVIMLKAGEVRGSHRISMTLTNPAAEQVELPAQDIYLEGDADRGANMIIQMKVEFKYPGLYWFDVFFGTTLIAKMPLRIVYRRN